MNLEEDYGNLGNLIAYLNGKDSLQDRLENATKIFFIPLSIPPQHKEEVVILWIADILSTDKLLNYTLEERELTWKCLRRLLTSSRLQALCSQHWVCSFTLSFIQTLVTTVSGTTTPPAIRKEAFLICHHFMNSPHLSPQVSQLSTHTLSLCTSMISWANKENLCQTLSSFFCMLLRNSAHILKNKMAPENALVIMYDQMLLPLLELEITLQQNPNAETRQLLVEIKSFLKDTVFAKKFHGVYNKVLEHPFCQQSKVSLSKEGDSFYAFIISCINKTDKDIATYLLKEFAYYYFDTCKSMDKICYRFIINVMHLLGVSLKDTHYIEEKNVEEKSISIIAQLPITCKDGSILSILEALLKSNFDANPVLHKIPFKKWITNLGTYFLKERTLTEETLKCLSIIAKIEPVSFISIPTLFSDLLVCNRSKSSISIMLDHLLCEILDIHKKLRTVHVLYGKLCQNILDLNIEDISKDVVLQDAWLTYEGNHLLPVNFMRRLVSSIKRMGTQMWLNLWQKIREVLSNGCHKALRQKDCSDKVDLVALVVWLTSVCMSATSFVETVSVSGMAAQVSNTMNIFAGNGMKLLVEDMLQLSKGKSALGCSVMNLMLVWSENHAALLSTDTVYKEQTKFHWKPIWECESPKDFSTQIPFVNKGLWTEILATCLNEDEDDACRFWIVQFLVQKVALIEAQTLEHTTRDMSFDHSVAKSLSNGCLSHIFEKCDTSAFPLSTDLVVFHLSSLSPLLKPLQWDQIARMFISGVEENRKAWNEFGKSSFFQDCGNLHSRCFSHLCSRMLLMLSGGKRKRDEDKLDKIDSKCKSKYMSRKILLSVIQLQSKATDQDLKVCFESLDTLLRFHKHKKSVGRLAKRSQEEVFGLLRVLEMYPLGLLHCNLTLSVIVFLLVLLVNEGGLNGRREVVLWVLDLLNRTVTSPHTEKFFILMKIKAYLVFMWFLTQGEQLLENISTEDVHLKIILEGEEPAAQNPRGTGDLVGELFYLISALTESFLTWTKTGKQVVLYAKALARDDGQDVNVKEMNLLFALTLGIRLKKRVENSKTLTPPFVEVLKTLGQWSLMVSQTVKLSDVTRPVLALCLTIFSTLLSASEKLRRTEPSQAERQTSESPARITNKTGSKESEEKTVGDASTVSLDSLDWEAIILNGVLLTKLFTGTENPQLKKLGFSFLVGIASSSRVFVSLGRLLAFRKALTFIPFDEELSDSHAIQSFFQTLPCRSYIKLLDTLLREIQTAPFESRILSQWLVMVDAKPSADVLQVRSEAMEQLISVLCIQIACQDVDRSGGLDKTLRVLEAVLKTESSNLSAHSKALVLNVFPKISSLTRSSSLYEFVKVFDGSVQLLCTLLQNEYHFVCERPVSIMSALTQLAFAVMERADESNQHLSQTTITEIDRCSNEVEKIVRDLRSFDYVFSKIIPFNLAKIVQKIQQTQLCSSVKESMERLVYNLLDFSDINSLRHLMITLPPSVTTLLKYYYDTFTHNFRFNPIST